MMHRNRVWQLATIPSPEELADKLANYTWVGCQAFVVQGHADYLFLNDATCADGAQEYAVVKKQPDGTLRQIESITFSWCSTAEALAHIRELLAGKADSGDFAKSIAVRIETPEQHGRCHLCA